jgi:protein PET100
MYILFPIGVMYYFGTNLDNKWSVPGFWPTPEQSNKIPTEKEEQEKELARLKAKRLAMRQLRMAADGPMTLQSEFEEMKAQNMRPRMADRLAASRREG